ncbi:hypothetical protein CN068_32590 [Sinorhizobium meliloti]|uniref:Uncharacterized protein n=2 Tax=Rhizobium meliloti TaxID=382 RepID=F7XA68_SINMM|nr:hypothetical protein [Sinorhizobium meliloti]AEH79164.1 hypothetical protein SM11_chr1897 [Sinorhizobium meliloti SM11]ARS72106.1 hypothetical protein SMRU11_35200 [Sinorhizobium meliloti RU11/001]ASP51385.1 hypothetical protein CDO31_07250 [Sinorhizobium meliloti]MBP2467313.1 hypothetical protein [Sinorhizobium meliloti]MDE3766317.1 hypothetical protein [Sinorhizobium meliloti]
MIDAQIKVDLRQFNRSLTDIERKQLPYAIMLTLNETAKGGRLEVQREMDRVFDRPTPYAKRGVVFDRASRQNLRAAVVVTGDRTKGGLPATAFLGPQIEGGMRTHKAFERQLVDRGLMQRNLVAVPAKRAPLDRYGNMTQGFLNRVMADLQIDYRGAGATRTRTSSSLKRNKNYKSARFFVPRQPSHLYPGVYQRDPATNAIHPVILFVPQVSYRIRLRLREVVERYVVANVHDHFAVAFQRAVRTAR